MKTKENMEILSLGQYLDLKEAGFEFEGQSYLFWEFMRILTALRRRNPNIMFLLENVEMGKKWESVLSDAIGIRGVHINAALVSAQNRKRIYWSNIRVREEGLFGYRYTDIPQPTDRGILLRDILEQEVDEKYYLKDEVVRNLLTYKERNKNAGNGFGAVFHEADGKMADKCNCLTTESQDIHLLFEDRNMIGSISRLLKNITDIKGKAHTLLASTYKGAGTNGMSLIEEDKGDGRYRIRRITPTECARLQTIPDWYIWDCSATQQYHLLGNGWTVEVIKHILSFMKLEDVL